MVFNELQGVYARKRDPLIKALPNLFFFHKFHIICSFENFVPLPHEVPVEKIPTFAFGPVGLISQIIKTQFS